MKKFIKSAIVLISGFSLTALAAEEKCVPDITKESMVVSGYYQFYLPSWWNDVKVVLPENTDMMTSDDKIKYMIGVYPRTKSNEVPFWKEEMKFRVLADTDKTAGFIAHGFVAGEDFCTAVKVYVDLYNLWNVKEKSKGDDYFPAIYLPYKVIEQFLKLENYEAAQAWLDIARSNWEIVPDNF